MSDALKQKPRVVILSAFFTPFVSGGERYAVEMVKRLADRYEITLITGRHVPTMSREELDGNVRIIRVGFGHYVDKYLYAPLAAWKAWRLKPDLVHAGMESFAGIALWLFHCLNKRTPCLLTLQNGSMDAPRFQKKFPFWLFKAIHLAPVKIQAISNSLAERARRLGAKDVVVVPNGAELEKFYEARRTVAKLPRIVGVGRLHVDKGWDTSIRAFAKIADRFPDITFVIGGGGDQEAFLKGLIRELKMEGRIELIGNVPYEQVPSFMASGLLFVGASRAEGLGNVFIEAQAAGTPPVATRVGGIPDVIQDGETGRLVPGEDVEALAAALAELLGDPVKREALRSNGLKYLDRYDWHTIAEEMTNMYEELLRVERKD